MSHPTDPNIVSDKIWAHLSNLSFDLMLFVTNELVPNWPELTTHCQNCCRLAEDKIQKEPGNIFNRTAFFTPLLPRFNSASCLLFTLLSALRHATSRVELRKQSHCLFAVFQSSTCICFPTHYIFARRSWSRVKSHHLPPHNNTMPINHLMICFDIIFSLCCCA